MNPIPASATQRATASGPRSMRTPSASRTSALPHALVAARLPCFATRPPAAATTIADTVEILKLLERSPPVPTISIASALTVTRTTTSRSAAAHPAISSTVSPRMCSAASSAPSCAGVASPAMTDVIAACASSRVRVRPAATIPSASRASTEVLQHAHAVRGHDRLWMELDGLERQRPVAQTHHDAVVASRRDNELRRQRRRVDHQRVVARRQGRVRDAAEDPPPIVTHERGLAVPWLRGADHLRAERDRGALEPETYAQRRDATFGRAADELRRSSGDLGASRSRRDHQTIRPRVDRSGEIRIVGP